MFWIRFYILLRLFLMDNVAWIRSILLILLLSLTFLMFNKAEAQTAIVQDVYQPGYYFLVNNNPYMAAFCVISFPNGFNMSIWIAPGMRSTSFPLAGIPSCRY